MKSHNSERGSVIVFITLMIVLLLIMVGLGLDTGQLTYSRSQGQAAVDAAALAAVSGLPTGSSSQVDQRVAAFNSNNDYVNKASNLIGGANITYVQYDATTGAINNLPGITNANGVRVALEEKNPYTGTTPGRGISTPAFLSPIMNLFGQTVSATTNVNVSAVAVLRALPSIPIAIKEGVCNGSTTVSNVKIREKGGPDNSCWTTYMDSASSDAEKRVRDLFEASTSCSGLPANSERITIDTPIELNANTERSTYEKANELFRVSNRDACWIVPVISSTASCTGSPSKIHDWARICPTDVVGEGESDSERYIKVNLTCRQEIFRAEDNLCFSPRLVRDTKSGM
jgi:Flp pilus assembly protein TadG